MSFPYKNPISSEVLGGPQSVSREEVYGSNFSVLQTGGYMEVYNLSDLNFTVPTTTGTVKLSGNTIPIRYTKGTGSSFSPNIITLNSDNISSGRRRLGMLVYVHETDQVYQYTIPNYDSLWSGLTTLTGLSGLSEDDYFTSVNSRSQIGQDFIDAWLDSSIEGVSGVTRNNARWRIFWGTDWQVTGGTIDYNTTGDLTLNSNSGNTVTISGLKTITGGTYDSGKSSLSLFNNLGETIEITGITSGGSVSISANTGLGIESQTLYTIYNSTLDPSLETVNDLGDIDAGTRVDELTGFTLVKLFDEILFPTVYPTYTIPTITLQGLNNGTYEVGSSLDIDINAYAVKNDSGGYQTLYIRKNSTIEMTDNSPTTSSVADLPSQFGYNNTNRPNSGYTSFIYSETLVIPAPTGLNKDTTTTYDVQGDYLSGNTLYTNKGNLDDRAYDVRETDAPQSGSNGFTSTPPKTITGIYPYFYGKSSGANAPTAQEIATAISGGTATKVLSSANGTLTIDYNTSGAEWIWFAHFENYPSKTVWFITDLNQGAIGDSLMENPYIHTMDGLSTDNYWSGVDFEVYVSKYPTTLTDNIQFKNS
jgi:hypothetical protein